MVKCNFQTEETINVFVGELESVEKNGYIDTYQKCEQKEIIRCAIKRNYGECDQDECIFIQR